MENELAATFCFNLPVDETSRKLGVTGVESFLKKLKRNPNVATVHAFSDFPYTTNRSPTRPLIEREYWLKLSRETLVEPRLAGEDGFIILHVHYSGEWRDEDTQAAFDQKRSVVTQINGRHTWDDSYHIRDRFFKKCLDLGKWREAKGTPILGNHEAPTGWKWRDDSKRDLTDNTSCLRDLLEKGKHCRKVVRQKYVDLVSAHVQSGAPSLTMVDGSNTKIFGHIPAGGEECLSEVDSHIPNDTQAVVPVSDVIVHGVGGLENILQELQHIADASSRKPDTTWKFEDKDELTALVHRVQRREATVVLRKLFLYRGECSVMQEIWIANKSNPDATGDPHKAYSVVHVHHHAAVARTQDVKPHHLDVVDAINARHLAARGSGCQGDNPFFETYIEPSGSNTYKVFAAEKKWECGKCGQENFQSKPLCCGRHGTVCSGLRPCVAWNWRQQTSRDEGMAQVLKCADAALKWVSGSGKSQSLHRITGDSSEGGMAFCSGFLLKELQQQYDANRKKVKHKSIDAEGTALSALCIEPNWSQLESPAHFRGSILTILFVGVDNGSPKDPDLNLNAEYENILQAHRESSISHCNTFRVNIRRLYFSDWQKVMVEITKENPTILHFGCHAQQEKGFELYRQTVKPSQILDAIGYWNLDARSRNPPRPDIRLIVLNACESDVHALELTACVDFAIGHQHPVLDKDAINFSRLLYDRIFYGATLLGSFHMAKGCVDGYMLQGQRDPRNFRFLVQEQKEREKREEGGGQTPASPISVNTSGNLSEVVASSPVGSSLTTSAVESATRYLDPDNCLDGVDNTKELIGFLESEGLRKIAPKICDKLEIERKIDLKDVTPKDISGLNLQDWQQKRLSNCIQLVKEAVAGAVTLRKGDLDDMDLFGADTASDEAGVSSESGDDYEVVAVKHPGNPKDFQEHMQGFMEDFLNHLWLFEDLIDEETDGFFVPALPQSTWTFCMLVWVRFAKDAYFDKGSRNEWLRCINSTNQDNLLAILDMCLTREGTAHTLWARAEFKWLNCSKDYAAAIFVTHMMVRNSLKKHSESARIWEQDIVQGWFQSRENAPAFLLRANHFLRKETINGMSVVQTVVKTQSYVAFMRMPKLVSLLFFEYLEACKLEEASAAGASGGNNLFLHGFCMFVSSSGRDFSFTNSDAHHVARHARPTVVQGLRCLAQLPALAFEMMGPVRTVRELCFDLEPKAISEASELKGLECLTHRADHLPAHTLELLGPVRTLEDDGMLPIHDASRDGHLDVIMLLAKDPVLLTIKTKQGSQPIHLACREGHLELVKWLLEQEEVSLTAEDNHGCHSIHLACGGGHLELAKWLMQQEGVSVIEKNEIGEQPIHVACWAGHVDVVKWLLEQEGVSLTAEGVVGTTPFHYASRQGHLDLVTWLVQQDDVSLTDEDDIGMQPIHDASDNGHLDVVKWLAQQNGVSLTADTTSEKYTRYTVVSSWSL